MIKTNAGELRGEAAPLYKRFPSQWQPQPAFIEIMSDGGIRARYDPEIGGAVPMDVYHGLILRVALPTPALAGDSLADWLESEDIQALLSRICAGMGSKWNGSNTVGTLTPDAEAALEELEREAAELGELADIHTPESWLEGSDDITITAETTDEELAALASRVEADVPSSVCIDGSFLRHLEELRAELANEAE